MLLRGGKEVWRSKAVALPWKADTDTFAGVSLPAVAFTSIRVEVVRWRGYSGGLAEVQVFRGKKNIALGCPARASAWADERSGPRLVTDGITTSAVFKRGYWMLPDKKAGWVEIDLARPKYARVRRVRVFANKAWEAVAKVRAGDVVEIEARGTWRSGPGLLATADGGKTPGGDHWGIYRERFYLRGRLGKEVFRIGSRHVLRVAADGVLEMGMQEDRPAWHANTTGHLDVTLTFRRVPG